MLNYAIVPVTHYQQNCSVIWCAQSREAAIIDPGGDLARVTEVVAAEGISVRQVLLTHGHGDHAGAARTLADQLAVPLRGPYLADRFWLQALPAQAQMMGLALLCSFRA